MKAKHVRSEWQQWVEWPYKNVSTLCGVKTAAHNSGIPGVTAGTEAYLDWCPHCAVSVSRTVEGLDNNSAVTDPLVKELYSRAWLAVQPTVMAERERQQEISRRIAASRAARRARETE